VFLGTATSRGSDVLTRHGALGKRGVSAGRLAGRCAGSVVVCVLVICAVAAGPALRMSAIRVGRSLGCAPRRVLAP
jgi:hypothetical protein